MSDPTPLNSPFSPTTKAIRRKTPRLPQLLAGQKSRHPVAFFVLRRLLVLALLLAIVSFMIFSLVYISPGDIVTTLLGTKPRTPETVAALRHEYHLDQPFLTQYWTWAKGALRFHFGNSVQTDLPVTQEITSRLPTTLFLACYAFIVTMLLGVGLGVAA